MHGKGAYVNVLDHAFLLHCYILLKICKYNKITDTHTDFIYVFKDCLMLTRLHLFVFCNVVFKNTVKQ